jgi:hypothetical protein
VSFAFVALYVLLVGSDSNPGTESSPLASFQQALRLIRFSRPWSGPIADLASMPATIYFRQGLYFFDQKVEMGVRDSYITISAYNNEEVVFSGGVDLSSIPFSVYEGSVLVAPLPIGVHLSVDALNELYIRGRRGVRARYPNGNPETQGLWTVNSTGYVPRATAWLPPFAASPPFNVTINSPARNSLHFPTYQLGVSGPADVFSPPNSFWCTTSPPAGSTFIVPSGFIYDAATWSNRTYSDPSIALVHTFHSMYWGNWIFAVADIAADKQIVTFSRGGFQEARGTNSGAEWYIENLLEELDDPEEWWVDTVNGMLYYYPNSTDSMLPDGAGNWFFGGNGTLVASQTPVILAVQGSNPDELVEGVTVQGITFAHASSTFMAPMEVPSGGDWTITRLGALRLEYVRNTTILECVFNGVGGNAVVVSRTAWNTTIIANEFVWIGASAILVAGEVRGMDGSSQVTYPVGTFIHANLFHELGIWVKQSSAVGVALAQATTIDANICFNLARACINFNDGFGGGSVVSNNLLFNSVRETDDHGLFNSWDRQVYLQRNWDGRVSLVPDQNYITHNFLLSNYHSVWPIDHDDGSQYYTDSKNYLVYGGYKSYLGNSLNVLDNIYILPDGKVDAQSEFDRASDRMFEDGTSNVLSGLSTIMHARVVNMDKRYRVDKRKWEQRDKRLRAGVPAGVEGEEFEDDEKADEGNLMRNWGSVHTHSHHTRSRWRDRGDALTVARCCCGLLSCAVNFVVRMAAVMVTCGRTTPARFLNPPMSTTSGCAIYRI